MSAEGPSLYQPELQRGCLLLTLSGHPVGLDTPQGPVHSAHIPAPALPGFCSILS